jgi:serine/threonine-protein kinase
VKPTPSLEDVAGAIIDGTPVDWNSVDSSVDLNDQTLVQQLKTLAALRVVARQPAVFAGPDATYWGHLRVFERIGRGAFADVHRAWDTRLDREVALKLLPDGEPGPAEAGHYGLPASSIIEEGRLLARVRHPNVATIYGAERIDGQVGLWMELVKGRTLEEALREGTRFSPKEVTRIGVDLCRAVSAVHAAGLLHRDIKAQNVMLADDGRVVLMDFGTGRELDDPSDTVSGTPLYLAPEVLAGTPATRQSDVYSIGVLLSHLLTGSYPVHAGNLADLRRAHAARQRPDLPEGSQAISTRLRRVIARALDPNPARRYASAEALGTALGASQQTLSRRTIIAMAAAAFVAVAASAFWQFRPAATVVDPVIAVMPFKNLSAEPDSDYFADGLTTEVIRNLGEIDGLTVRSQTSSFFFKGRGRNLREIDELLHPDYIVEAAVFRDGDRLRINAQLVKVEDDKPLFTEQFERTVKDVFAIQDEISLRIVNQLRLTLGRGQRRYQTNLQAYELYLRARAVPPGRGDDRGRATAVKLLEQVIAIDPTFAPAYAALASTYLTMGWNIGVLEDIVDLRPAASRALELDPLLAESHLAMGIANMQDRDWTNAVKSFERALALNPSLTEIHLAYSDALMLTGQPARGLQLLEQAVKMDPLSLTVQRDLAFAQFLNHRFEDAVATLRTSLAADPESTTDLVRARVLTAAGRPEEAIGVWTRRLKGDWERWLARAYIMTGRPQEVERLLADPANHDAYHQAIIYAGLRNKDRTLEALDRAADVAPHRTAALVCSPETEFLRGDARLGPLRRKLKLPVE